MAIEYTAYNENWDVVRGILELESRERAQEVLQASNVIVISLKKRGKRATLAELMPTWFGVKPGDVITFTRELASLLESGIALLPALRVLQEQAEKRALKDAILSVMREIETGNSFSQACAKQPAAFPPSYSRLVQLAEETGELRKILLQIVVYMERQRATVGKVRKALTYPAIVAGVGVVAIFILVTYALPSMVGLLTEYGGQLPLATRLLIGASKIGQAYGMYVFAGVVALSLLGRGYIRTPEGKKRWDSLVLKLPVIGGIVNLSQMARLCSSLTTMLAGGLVTAEALYHSIEVATNSVFRQALSEAYREVLTGSRLAPALAKQEVFPRLLCQTVAVGEAAGNLRVNLAGITDFYEQEVGRVVARTTDLIEPAVILVMGGVVGLIAVAVVGAIYSIIPHIK